jgi:hypothetical protein
MAAVGQTLENPASGERITFQVDARGPLDPLGEAGHFLCMSGAFYCRSELSAPWGLSLPPMPGYLWFHVVTAGYGWLERPPTTLICGAVRFDHPAADNLIEILPETIQSEASNSPQTDWIQRTLRLIAAESPGAATRRRGRDHAPRRHPRHSGHPILDRDRRGRTERMAGRASGQADRTRDLTHSQ